MWGSIELFSSTSVLNAPETYLLTIMRTALARIEKSILATFLITSFVLISNPSLLAQETYPVNGTLEKDLTVYKLTGATIHKSATETMTGDLVIFQGKIVAAGESAPEMPNTRTIDVSGMHIYPSFIDLYTDYGMPDAPKKERQRGPQFTSNKKGAFGWNEAIRPEMRAAEDFTMSSKDRESWLSGGYGAVLTHHQDGIARGTGAFVLLADNDNASMLNSKAAAFYSFRKGSSRQDYPSSLMGAIALLRQTYYDAEWYNANASRLEGNLSLEAWNNNMDLPQIFAVSDRLDVLRADKIADEFEQTYIFKGDGDEYQRLEAMKNTGSPFIIPLDFPTSYDVSDPYTSRFISLGEMKHWEMAPANAAMLEQAGVPFVFTADGLKSPSQILSKVRKCIQNGLSQEKALEALTQGPAVMVGMEDKLGTLEQGKLANFIITDGDIFQSEATILENWVAGKQEVLKDWGTIDLSGEYSLTFEDQTLPLSVKGEPGKYKASFEVIRKGDEGPDTLNVKVKLEQDDEIFKLSFGPVEELFEGVYRFSGNAFGESRIWKGKGEDPNGDWVDWAAVKGDSEEKKQEEAKPMEVDSLGTDVMYPFMAYGWTTQPEQEFLHITNATLWTCEEDGIIEGGEMLVRDGKIVAVGKGLDVKGLLGKAADQVSKLDAKGAHITPGIIDEHSHIAISRGVNEGTQTSSAEVSIATVVNSEDINIYRQLSGGVTCSQLLHGSANPIGGQSGIIKLRWGTTPDEMVVQDADPFIKFALGENVKQSNWGDDQRERFPQTRMGVEQVYYDHFIKAREYEADWAAYNKALDTMTRKQKKRGEYPDPPRKDIETEAILQILNSERFVTCHSYRQDEINMLMHVADSMGFTLNTFTHILEGYKLADKMKAHGAGGSSFSDWWAYKFEVKDAIPHNGAILWEQGVVTAFNSDDAEMARRLNQEAAKAVKYGGVPEEEALKFVTLNPAKLLHLDDRMGSLKAGKDADFVIWTDHPLSIYAQAKSTFVDGRRYYDQEKDAEMRKAIKAERARLIQKMVDGVGGKKKPSEKVEKHYHCDTLTEEIR